MNLFMLKYFISRRNLSKGLWISNLNRVKLERAKGKFLHHVGYVSDYASEQKTENEKLVKYDFLYPEEAIYLLENVNNPYAFSFKLYY